MGEPALRSCPFCGEKQKLRSDGQYTPGQFVQIVHHGSCFYVACNKCRAEGPKSDKSEDAVIGWNGAKRGKKCS